MKPRIIAKCQSEICKFQGLNEACF